MKLIYEMDSLTEEWSSSGPQLYDLAADVRDMDFELSDQLNRFLRLREEVIDPTLHTVRHCMRFHQHVSDFKIRIVKYVGKHMPQKRLRETALTCKKR
ncbi:hypothetical protein ANCCAN_08520 [Ancylostoma caninum]|uniref:Uncharacterized protein n=1 Tax=Ancylostoma caninum TaxID=29170 RepID=A0A368GM31_ANCCA|nr:hypothetical protein ANCCAN_08520 [Ancylostoma caninum]